MIAGKKAKYRRVECGKIENKSIFCLDNRII